MPMSLTGHLGARAADLVDGRLAPQAEERAWQHVLACPGCRQRVEEEGWAKRQLGGLNHRHPYDPDGADASGSSASGSSVPGSSVPALSVPGALRDVLHELEDLDTWLVREAASTQRPLRRTSLALAGVGTVGAAVLGLATLTSPPTAGGEAPRSPASIRSAVPSTGGAGVVEPVNLPHRSK